MAVYMIGFALSVGLIAFSEKKRLPVFLTCSFFALLIPCLIAGLRAQHIGTDVLVYVKPLTESAICADNLTDYFHSYWFRDWRNLYVQYYELGFSMLVYLVSKLTKSLGCVLFAISAVIVTPIYIALSRNRKKAPVWLGMLTFYLLYFGASLNIMRQWAAMALLLLALQLLQEKKYGWTVFLSLFACLFHNSAIIVFLIYAVYGMLRASANSSLVIGRLKVSGPVVTLSVVFACSLLLLLCLNLVVKLMVAVGFTRFVGYISGNPLSLLPMQILFRLPLVLLFLLCWRQFSAQNRTAPFFLMMLLLDILLSQLMSVASHAVRIGLYFSAYTVLWIPAMHSSLKTRRQRTLFCIAIIGYLLVYFLYNYVLQGRNQIYPYAFAGM